MNLDKSEIATEIVYYPDTDVVSYVCKDSLVVMLSIRDKIRMFRFVNFSGRPPILTIQYNTINTDGKLLSVGI